MIIIKGNIYQRDSSSNITYLSYKICNQNSSFVSDVSEVSEISRTSYNNDSNKEGEEGKEAEDNIDYNKDYGEGGVISTNPQGHPIFNCWILLSPTINTVFDKIS
ncbi:hypothetical protein Glove_851g6 [Diversispora epigaea]|uniref:Uncharacterized protein n=1 Tax=Diversispora epigaea TaxID=1348612 RepID=A0A397FYV0_9GLOM|nr:hypothetical protein Glove_851g6 [Diversispora epigaea]